jgi:hypothetical protein
MPDMIKDGRGTSSLAHVNKDGQLVTRAVAVEQRMKSALDQNYFEATTGRITLTDAVETGIIYIKNTNSNKVLVIDRVFYDLWTSTDGSGADGILRYYKDCTISGGTDIVPNCTYYGSAETAEGTFKKSLTSISGTEWWTAYVTDKSSAALEEGKMVLPANGNHAITIAAPTGNTSMIVSINIAFYYFDATLV